MTAALVTTRYALLDELPGPVRAAAITHVYGELPTRLRSLVTLRRALLDGRLPLADELGWPDAEITTVLLEDLRAADVARFCASHDDLTNDVLLSFLDVVERTGRVRRRAIAGLLGGAGCSSPAEVDPADLARWRERISRAEWERIEREAAMLSLAFASQQSGRILREEWTARQRAWADLEGYLDALLAHTFAPPTRTRGWLRSVVGRDVGRIRTMLSHLPPLADLVRTLGRAQESENADAPPTWERILGPIRRTREIERPIDRAPIAEVRGIERSGEIARMLASEAVLLSRPRLRPLFHLRLVERTLMTYHAEGVLTRRIQTESGAADGLETREKRAERGPIVLLFDTSGSMRGKIGEVAAAIALQIVCLAHFERRLVLGLNFSGPGDLVEHELGLEEDGLAAFLGFLTMRFDGGTVIDAAMERALARIETGPYAYADIVIVSDGQLFVDPSTFARLAAVRRKRDVRVHGLLTGAPMAVDRLKHLMGQAASLLIPGGPRSDARMLGELVDELHDLTLWQPRG